MDFVADLADWFTDPANWSGAAGIPGRTWEHVQISVLAVALACLIAVPPAMALGHTGRGGFVATSVVNIGRAIPSFAILALALPLTIEIARSTPLLSSGLGFAPTFLALLALAIPPIFTNTYTGVREVDPGMVEAARGMGMKEREILFGIEAPMAVGLMVAGIRVAAVQVVATATLGALVAWGGLGRFIIDGFAQRDTTELVAGAILVAVLAIATEVAFAVVERLVSPAGVRRGTGAGSARSRAV